MNITTTTSSPVTTTPAGQLWNGPICPTCDRQYVGSHACTPADVIAKAKRLLDVAATLAGAAPTASPIVDRTAGCPCRKENGGSGVCGCIFGGAQITC